MSFWNHSDIIGDMAAITTAGSALVTAFTAVRWFSVRQPKIKDVAIFKRRTNRFLHVPGIPPVPISTGAMVGVILNFTLTKRVTGAVLQVESVESGGDENLVGFAYESHLLSSTPDKVDVMAGKASVLLCAAEVDPIAGAPTTLLLFTSETTADSDALRYQWPKSDLLKINLVLYGDNLRRPMRFEVVLQINRNANPNILPDYVTAKVAYGAKRHRSRQKRPVKSKPIAPLALTVTAYSNDEAPAEKIAEGLDSLNRKVRELSRNTVCLTAKIEPEASDHLTNVRKQVGSKWVVGAREPRQKPATDYQLSMSFSKTLRYEDGSPGPEGIGGPHDCCIHTDFINKPATTLHELLHTLQGQFVAARYLPSVDDNASFTYPGIEADSHENGWWNWYRALLTGSYRSKPS